MDTASGEAIATLQKKFIEEALEQFTDSAGKLTEAISSISEVGEKSEEILDGKLGNIMDKIGDVVEVIEKIKPIAQKVEALLS